MPRFRTADFIRDHFDTPVEMGRTVRAYGLQPPTLAQTAKWRQRSQVAGDWLAVLIVIAELEGNQPVSLLNYVELGGGA